MTRKTHSLRHAGTAIAAVLVIASTPSFAQEVSAPVSAAPAPVPEPVPQPVIVVPDIPAPAAPEATVQPIPTTPETTAVDTPEPAAAPARTTTTTRTRAAAPAARAAPVAAAPLATPEPTAVEAAPVAPVAVAAPVAEPAAPVVTTEPPVRSANDDIGIVALVLGGLVILALAIWGFVAIGRRKPIRRYAAETTTVVEPVATPRPAVVTTPVVERPAETRLNGPSFTPRPAAVVAAPAGALPHTGASVALPRTLPEGFEERETLFKRMVDAKPDRANPFTDRKARMKRARLIMQSIGRDFGDAEPWIDLSQYPNNWPELARRRSAAA